jgi:Tol biopolymer transport system component
VRRCAVRDLDQLLRSEISLTAAQAVETCDFAIVERRAAQRRRTRAVLALSTTAAAVVLTVLGSLQVASRDGASRTVPIQQPTPTATAAPMVNGALQSAEAYVAGLNLACPGCKGEEPTAFQQGTGRVLLTSRRDGFMVALRVVAPDGQLARLTCPDDFPCAPEEPPWSGGAAALGPGPDEITLTSAGRLQLRVIGFDGKTRRTLDLSPSLSDRELIDGLVWAPDGRRLAVKTSEGVVRRVWLLGRDSDDAQLVYTARYTEARPKGSRAVLAYLGSLGWSPDSKRLAFIEEHAHFLHSSEVTDWTRAESLLLPEPGQDGPGVVQTLYEFTSRAVNDAAAVVWSPDGSRVAVRAPGGIFELSSEDGTTLRRRPNIRGLLLWSARQH